MLSDKVTDRFFWLVLLACAIFLSVTLAFCRGAFANEVQFGTGLSCDTQAQVEQYAKIADQDDALQTVNAADPTACGILQIFYVEIGDVSRVTNMHGSLRVVQIIVVGILTPLGPQRVQPMHQFILIPSKDREA